MPAEAVVETLRQVLSVLDELHIPTALMGGLSLAAWNRVRSTHDVDVLILLSGVRLQTVLSIFGGKGFRAKGREALIRVDDAEFVQLMYEPPGCFIDVQVDFLLAETEFLKTAMARRVSFVMQELGEVHVLTCEDLIIMKLLAGRMIDLVDAAALLHANRDRMDSAYVSQWVSQLSLEQPYRDTLNEATRMGASPI